jgi:hypothetical protein
MKEIEKWTIEILNDYNIDFNKVLLKIDTNKIEITFPDNVYINKNIKTQFKDQTLILPIELRGNKESIKNNFTEDYSSIIHLLIINLIIYNKYENLDFIDFNFKDNKENVLNWFINKKGSDFYILSDRHIKRYKDLIISLLLRLDDNIIYKELLKNEDSKLLI